MGRGLCRNSNERRPVPALASVRHGGGPPVLWQR